MEMWKMGVSFSLFLCLLFSLFFISSCSKVGRTTDSVDLEQTSYQNVNNLAGVTMAIGSTPLTSSGGTIILTNKTDTPFTYGEAYSLEKNINNQWYKVPAIVEEYGFEDIGYELAAADSSEWSVNWEWLYGKLESGEYRILKDVLDVKQPGEYTTYYLSTTFILD